MFVNSIVCSSICLSYVRSWAVCTRDFIYSWGFVLGGVFGSAEKVNKFLVCGVNWFYVVLKMAPKGEPKRRVKLSHPLGDTGKISNNIYIYIYIYMYI